MYDFIINITQKEDALIIVDCQSHFLCLSVCLSVCFCMFFMFVFFCTYCFYCSMGSPDSNKLTDWLTDWLIHTSISEVWARRHHTMHYLAMLSIPLVNNDRAKYGAPSYGASAGGPWHRENGTDIMNLDLWPTSWSQNSTTGDEIVVTSHSHDKFGE